MGTMPSNTSAPDIQAVLFDYGLVLTAEPHPPAWARMKGLLQAPEEPFHAAYWRYRHDYDRGTLTGSAYWHKVASDLHQTLDHDTLNALIQADTELWTQPNPPMIAWAQSLQRAGVRTGILSNLGDAMELGVRERCPWLNAFNSLTFSHRLGTAKPDLSIYRHAAADLGVDPAHILFIDDREENISAARDAGMQAIRYTNHTAFEHAMQAAQLDSLLAHATKV